MASLFEQWPPEIRLLDPGAGVGSLCDAFVSELEEKTNKTKQLDIIAYEVDRTLIPSLSNNLETLCKRLGQINIQAKTEIRNRDFVEGAIFSTPLFSQPKFSHALLNPPYRKIGTNSEHRNVMRTMGVEAVNLYVAFLAIAVEHTKTNGEIVAIVPRSFCNGVYFRQFRSWLLDRCAIKHIHVFNSRRSAFKDDEILQENVVIHLCRGAQQREVRISESHDATFSDYVCKLVEFADVIAPADREKFIHIPIGDRVICAPLANSLDDLGLEVSTGPVVDFRLRDHWLLDFKDQSVPLLYAHHFRNGVLNWPQAHKKPNALALNEETAKWLLPRDWYVVTKRFSSKEERRRVVAYVVDPTQLPTNYIGFENHLNVIHFQKKGIREDLARGLAIFLNSTAFDQQFRSFSGHTQVNATDLRNMKYPNKEQLERFGRWAISNDIQNQEALDSFVGATL
jgi:adenine-specific DNA-methyltransferase